MRHFTGVLAFVILTAFVTESAWSSESDELRAKANALQHEAEDLAKEGHKEQADKLFREAKELLNAASKQDSKSPKGADREIDKLHQRLNAIAEKEEHAEKSKNKPALAELRELREAVERELAERTEHLKHKADTKLSAKHSPEVPEPMHEAARRLKHLYVATENLNAAGMHDLADELTKKAERMQRELQQAHEKFAKERPAEKPKYVEPPLHNPDWNRKRSELKLKSAPAALPMNELREELQRP